MTIADVGVGQDPGVDGSVAEVLRSVNDRISELAEQLAHDDVWQFLCECGGPDCHEVVNLRLSDFERRRSGAGEPIVAPGHDPDGPG